MNAAFEYDDLIHRYLDGLCSETEAAVLFSALAKSTDLQEMFQRAVRLQTILRETASSYVAPADLASRVMQSVGLDPVPTAALASAASTSQTKLGRFFIPLLALGFFAAGTLSTWLLLYPTVLENTRFASSSTIPAELSKTSQSRMSQIQTSALLNSTTSISAATLQQTQSSGSRSIHSVLSTAQTSANASMFKGEHSVARSSKSTHRQHVLGTSVVQEPASQRSEAGLQKQQPSVEDGSPTLGSLSNVNKNVIASNNRLEQSATPLSALSSQENDQSNEMLSTIGSAALALLMNAPTNPAAPSILTSESSSKASTILPNSLRCSLSALATRSANVAGANTAPLTQDFQLRDWSVGCLWNLNSWLDLGVIAGNEYLPLYAVTTTQNGTTYKLENSRPWVALNSQVHCNLDGTISDKSDWQWLGSAHAGMSNAGTHLGFSFGIAHSLTNNIHIALSPEYRLQFLSDSNSQYRANRLGIDIVLFYTL